MSAVGQPKISLGGVWILSCFFCPSRDPGSPRAREAGTDGHGMHKTAHTITAQSAPFPPSPPKPPWTPRRNAMMREKTAKMKGDRGAGPTCLTVRTLPLDLVHKVKVGLVEVVYADVAVLAAARVAAASGVGRDGVLGKIRLIGVFIRV